MAKTITQLPDATVVNGWDELIIQQSGVTKRATKTEVLAGIVNANIAAGAAIVAAKLASDSITDTQISPTAEILGTKIAPNFGALNILTTGTSTSTRVIAGVGSEAAPSITFSGDGDTGIFKPSVGTIALTVNNSEEVRITSAGNVGIANSAPTERLHVTGNIKASGFIDADTSFRGAAIETTGNATCDRAVAGIGSAAAPSFTFTGDGNTGMFRPAAETIAFATNGVEKMRIDSGGVETTSNFSGNRLIAGEGTTGAPGIVFTGDGDTGMWHPGVDVVAFSVGGTEKLRINSGGIVATQLTGNAATATALATAHTIDISGDITATATSFNGSANITIPAVITAGVIVNADVNASAAIAGTKIDPDFGDGNVVTTGNLTATRLAAADGTVSLPGIMFTGDGNTGIFHPAADTIAFCEGGTEAMRINSSGLVGVATTDPQYRLDVNGVVNSASHYRVDGQVVVGARRLGWESPGGTATRSTFATASVTLPDLAERVHALIDDLIAHGLIGPTV